MRPPKLPQLQALRPITPSLYNAGLACPARALWTAFGDRSFYPTTPAACLGNAFHGVLEDCAKGLLPTEVAARQSTAADLFEQRAMAEAAKAHPLLRWRYPDVRWMPGFFTFQARTGAAAARIVSRLLGENASGNLIRRAEVRMTSRDNLVTGRIDLVETREKMVVDYKSGGDPPPGVVFRETEERQLRLYAHLCAENGIVIEKGVIERGSGRRDEMSVTSGAASAEGEAARALLSEINARIGRGATLHEFARPSPETCRGCPGRVLCEPFWNADSSEWQDSAPTHVEGEVLALHKPTGGREPTFTVHLRILRGNLSSVEAVTDAFPTTLCSADGDALPKPGELIRILDAKAPADSPRLLRPFLGGPFTTVWRVGSEK